MASPIAKPYAEARDFIKRNALNPSPSELALCRSSCRYERVLTVKDVSGDLPHVLQVSGGMPYVQGQCRPLRISMRLPGPFHVYHVVPFVRQSSWKSRALTSKGIETNSSYSAYSSGYSSAQTRIPSSAACTVHRNDFVSRIHSQTVVRGDRMHPGVVPSDFHVVR